MSFLEELPFDSSHIKLMENDLDEPIDYSTRKSGNMQQNVILDLSLPKTQNLDSNCETLSNMSLHRMNNHQTLVEGPSSNSLCAKDNQKSCMNHLHCHHLTLRALDRFLSQRNKSNQSICRTR